MQNPSNNCLLKKVEEQEVVSRKFGFYWEHINQLLDQIQSECQEVKEAWQNNDRENLQEEIGDLIQATVCLAVFCDFDPHETLLKSNEKFQRRYDKLVELVHNDGYKNLQRQSFDVLMNYWNRAKQKIKES